MKIEDLRAFVAVVRHKSISRAAEAMQINQSIVTRRVQSLEDSLGVELLDRHTRPPVPTDKGWAAYEQALSIVQQVERLGGLVDAPGRAMQRLRIGMPQFLGEALSFETVRSLKASHPDLAIQITTALSPTLMDSIELGELDAALVVLPEDAALPAHLTGEKVEFFTVGILAPVDAFPNTPLTLREINRHGWVLNPPGCGFRANLEQALSRQGLPLNLNLDVFGTELQFELVANGLGLGLAPRFLLEGAKHAAALCFLVVAEVATRNAIWLIRSKGSASLNGAIAALSVVTRMRMKSQPITS